MRLSDVLKAAGVKPSAVFTGHYGTDRSLADASKDALSRGVPIKKAMDGSNLIVFAMNGQPLSSIHGGPLRLIIPGWPGSVSAKWFNRLWVRDKYHGPAGARTCTASPSRRWGREKNRRGNFRVQSMTVRSIITSQRTAPNFRQHQEVKLVAPPGRRQHRVRSRFDRLRARPEARQTQPRRQYDWQRVARVKLRRTVFRNGNSATTRRGDETHIAGNWNPQGYVAITCIASRCWSMMRRPPPRPDWSGRHRLVFQEAPSRRRRISPARNPEDIRPAPAADTFYAARLSWLSACGPAGMNAGNGRIRCNG